MIKASGLRGLHRTDSNPEPQPVFLNLNDLSHPTWTSALFHPSLAAKIVMATPSISSSSRSKRAQQTEVSNETPGRNRLIFDILPNVATEHIVQLILPEWKLNEEDSNQFSVDTVLALVKSGGSLRRAAQTAFPMVQFSVDRHVGPKKGAVQVRGTRQDVGHLLKDVSVGIGERIHTMLVSAPLPYTFTRAISNHCTGLRRLVFKPSCAQHFPNANFCAILAARGSGFESLDISDFSADEEVVASSSLETCLSQITLLTRTVVDISGREIAAFDSRGPRVSRDAVIVQPARQWHTRGSSCA